MLFCLVWSVPTALEVLHSSLPSVGCLCLADRGAGLGMSAGGCEGSATPRLGEGRPRKLLLLSSHEDPATVDFLDSAYKESICDSA